MDRSTKIAYTEVNKILNLMDNQLQEKVPQKLKEIISLNTLSDYDVIINPEISLNEQNISRKALAILAVLNYNYWCIEKDEKEKIIKEYKNNEKIKQEKLRMQYNPDKIFKNEIAKKDELIIYNRKENCLLKLIKKIKQLIKLT